MALSSALLGVLGAKVVRAHVACELNLDVPLRLWTGAAALNWNGHTWTPGMLDLSGLSTSEDLDIDRAQIRLQGIEPELASLATVVDADVAGRTFTGWLLGFAEDGTVAGHTVVFAGRADTLQVADSGTAIEMGLAVENEMVVFQRIRGGLLTHEDQQARFAGDTGLSRVSTARQEISWGVGNPPGGAAVTPPSANPPGSGPGR